MKIFGRKLALALILVPCLAASALAEPATRPAVPAAFMRFVDDGHGGGSLQTADVAFTNAAGARVDLIGAVHIGEKSYYDGLNQDFKGYDAVLYELIKSRDAGVPTPETAEQSHNPIITFQRFLKNSLELDFQLDDIDYTAANFVHADLDKETFEKMQEERGESFSQIMMRQIIRSFTEPPPAPKAQPATQPSAQDAAKQAIGIFVRPDMERQIKVIIARQIGDMDTAAMGLDGPDGSVILTERNKAAMAVLSKTMDSGKKRIAIFYGAAHMPDMAKRLEQMGFSPRSTRWNLAWDLTIRADQPSAVEKAIDGFFDAFNDDN